MSNKIFSWVPNGITCLNLVSGCIGIVLAFNGKFELASLAICIAALFDYMDGAAARLMKAYSAMGAELDSLSDLVSFGVAPAAIVYGLLPAPYSWTAIAIPVCGALRLARFNVDDSQTDSFLGLPIPANALFWIGCAAFWANHSPEVQPLTWAIVVLVVAMSMVLPIRLPSLKFHDLKFAGINRVRYFIIIISIALLALLGVPGLAVAIAFYLLLGAITSSFKS